MDTDMLEGFRTETVQLGEAAIRCAVGGDGPPVLLLHGYPQTHVLWRKIAPELARRSTVVAADLRGYGGSWKPPGGPDHAGYSKRAMAADQMALMRHLGFERFAVVGHDRGARVAHRMALDWPDRVDRLAVLDIIPTAEMFARTDKAFATAYYHWFFLIQPHPMPERMIGADPEFFLRWTLDSWCRTPGAIEEAAVAAYLDAFRDPETIRATCDDYRAAAGIDLVHDAEDRGRKIACPLLALWGREGIVGRAYDVLAVWRERAGDVRGHAVPGGHFPPEEAPDETTQALLGFLR